MKSKQVATMIFILLGMGAIIAGVTSARSFFFSGAEDSKKAWRSGHDELGPPTRAKLRADSTTTITSKIGEEAPPLFPEAESPRTSSYDVELHIAPEVLKEAQRRIGPRLKLIQRQLYWQSEDRILRKIPKFDDVRQATKKSASEIMEARSTGWEETEAVLELAQTELDAFWDAGGLGSSQAYGHGYLARAILEVALDHAPANFRLLALLRETVSATMPMVFADYRRNDDAVKVLWSIVERQRELVESGRAPPSPMTFDAMYDWIQLVVLRTGRPQEAAPAWKWLVENAEAGGWAGISDICKRGLEAARRGRNYSAMIYICPQSDAQADKAFVVKAMHGRRLRSLKGSRERRAQLSPIWAPDARHTMSGLSR